MIIIIVGIVIAVVAATVIIVVTVITSVFIVCVSVSYFAVFGRCRCCCCCCRHPIFVPVDVVIVKSRIGGREKHRERDIDARVKAN